MKFYKVNEKIQKSKNNINKMIEENLKVNNDLNFYLPRIIDEIEIIFEKEKEVLIIEEDDLYDVISFFLPLKNIPCMAIIANKKDEKYNSLIKKIHKKLINFGYLSKKEILKNNCNDETFIIKLLENDFYVITNYFKENSKILRLFLIKNNLYLDKAFKYNWKIIEYLDLYDYVNRFYSPELKKTYLDYLLSVENNENDENNDNDEFLKKTISKLREREFKTIYQLIYEEIYSLNENKNSYKTLELTSNYINKNYSILKENEDESIKNLRRILLIGLFIGNISFLNEFVEDVKKNIQIDLINHSKGGGFFSSGFTPSFVSSSFLKDTYKNDYYINFLEVFFNHKDGIGFAKESIHFLLSRIQNPSRKTLELFHTNFKIEVDEVLSSLSASRDVFFQFGLNGSDKNFLEEWFIKNLFYDKNREFKLYESNLGFSYYYDFLKLESKMKGSFIRALEKLKAIEFLKILSQKDYSNRTILHYSFILDDKIMIEALIKIIKNHMSTHKNEILNIFSRKDLFEYKAFDYNKKFQKLFEDEFGDIFIENKSNYNFMFSPSLLDILMGFVNPNSSDLYNQTSLYLEDDNLMNILNLKLKDIRKEKKKINLKTLMQYTDNVNDSSERSLRKYLKNNFSDNSFKTINFLKRLGYSIVKTPSKSQKIIDLFKKNPTSLQFDKILEIITFNLLTIFINIDKNISSINYDYNNIKILLNKIQDNSLNEDEIKLLCEIDNISEVLYGEPIIKLIESLKNNIFEDYNLYEIPTQNQLIKKIEIYKKEKKINLNKENKKAIVAKTIEKEILYFLIGQGYNIEYSNNKNLFFK